MDLKYKIHYQEQNSGLEFNGTTNANELTYQGLQSPGLDSNLVLKTSVVWHSSKNHLKPLCFILKSLVI